MHEIVLKPEILGFLGIIPITNTLLVSLLVSLVLILVSFIVSRNLKKNPDALQNILEIIIEGIYNLTEELAPPSSRLRRASHSRAKTFFPIVTTFFLFIALANLLGLLPGFGTITLAGKPLLRSINSDLNMTLALALVSAVLTHIFAIKFLGIKNYLLRWVSLNPVFLFVGFLEIISEFTKIISLSFRLFGNIFAGEVVLATVSGIFAFLVPLPFYLLEIIVGLVQASVFMMLTLVFMVLLSEKHEGHV